ncbi:hypothetical protein HFD88_005861 [Aspergillus terreus]|nr:hypothetical protein HFD88_005861 [Aspergillus terreus]
MRSASAVVFWLLSYATAECPSEYLPPPERHSDGEFFYPNGAPQCFSRGSQMNVSWCSVYDAVNLYLAQWDGYFTTAVGIVMNTASTWHVWTVDSDATNHSTSFVFYVGKTRGTSNWELFLSHRFYIDFGQDSPTSTASSAQPTSTQTTTGNLTVSSSSMVMNQSSAATEQSGLSHATTLELGLGIGLGVPFCIAVGVALFFARKRKGPPPLTTEVVSELDRKTAGPSTQELDGDNPWDAKHPSGRRTTRDMREVDIFVANKLKDVAAYDEVKEKVEHYKALMDCEEMTRRIHSYCILPSRFWLMLDRD